MIFILKSLCNARMVVALLMGFSCGLPLLLTMGVLQAWMKEEGIDLGFIGLVSLLQIPYTWKFLWAPFFDRFTLPFLGRRRGWLILSQILLICSIAGMGFTDPVLNAPMMIFTAVLVSFFSASQDIVVDAYRREDLSDEELGLGSSLYIYGYRIGMLLASGGGLIMADYMPFSSVYFIMAICMMPCICVTLIAHEPENSSGKPKTLKEALFDPFTDFFGRSEAIWILAFILFYKLGDSMASAMTTPFFLDLGFSKSQIGMVVKVFGFWATILGAFIGGVILLKLGISRSLWIFGFLQALSTACFSILANMGNSLPVLSFVIAFENLSSGMGTSAYVAFMASITNKKFTATQYAFLSCLMALPRVVASSLTGFIVKNIGWNFFFIACTFVAIPGLLLLFKFAPFFIKSNNEQI